MGETYLSMADALDSQEFYELMRAYRHAVGFDQSEVIAAFEAVKSFINDVAMNLYD